MDVVFSSSESSDDNQPIIGEPADKAAVAAFHEKISEVETQVNAFRKEVFKCIEAAPEKGEPTSSKVGKSAITAILGTFTIRGFL